MARTAVSQKVAKIYQTYRMGDHITDAELNFAIGELIPTVDLLNALGERFHHAWWDLFQCLTNLQEYRAARQRNKKKTVAAA